MAWITGSKALSFVDRELSVTAYLTDNDNPDNLKKMPPIHLVKVSEVAPQEGTPAAQWDAVLVVEAGSELGFHVTVGTRYGFGFAVQSTAEVIWDGYYQTNRSRSGTVSKMTANADRYFRASHPENVHRAIKVQTWQEFEDAKREWTEFQRISVTAWPLLQFKQGGESYGEGTRAVLPVANLVGVNVSGGGLGGGRDVGDIKHDPDLFQVIAEDKENPFLLNFSVFVAKNPSAVGRDLMVR